MLGQFAEALDIYRPADAPLRGDALIALGRLDEIRKREHVPHPWQSLWQAYRAHALCLLGDVDESLRLAQAAIPLDIYEWVHLFEALLRLDRIDVLDYRNLPAGDDSEWTRLARRRLELDRRRRGGEGDATRPFLELIEAYDRAGLPLERALTRLSLARHQQASGKSAAAAKTTESALEIGRTYRMPIVIADALLSLAESDPTRRTEAESWRQRTGFAGPARP
jgi:tetratricopeptide (TPR) repeat protein